MAQSAVSFWEETLAGFESELFPMLTPSRKTGEAVSSITCEYDLPSISEPSVTVSTLIQAAWAFTASVSSGLTTDIVFGSTVINLAPATASLRELDFSAVSFVPLRIRVDFSRTISSYLQDAQRRSIDLRHFEHTNSEKIQSISIEANRACHFRTVLTVLPPQRELEADDALERWQSGIESRRVSNHALHLAFLIDGTRMTVRAVFDPSLVDGSYMRILLGRFAGIVQQMASNTTNKILTEIDVLPTGEQERIWKWNHGVPIPAEQTVHSLIEERAKGTPDAVAVCAWDGELTYTQLDRLATRLAQYLIRLRVGPQTMVPLCFEKSAWMTVAMLAVLKAGGVIVPLDNSHPTERLQSIVHQTRAKVLLCSATELSRCRGLTEKAFAIDGPSLTAIDLSPPGQDIPCLPESKAQWPMYVIFTSGSTGQPKGVIISHTAMCSAIAAQAGPMRYSSSTRTYDFSTYAFDMSMESTFLALATGGCVCVPSDFQRKNDLSGSIQEMKATHITLTPSVARILHRSSMTTLRTLVLGGEEARPGDLVGWPEETHIIVTYGPAECTPVSLIEQRRYETGSAVSMGYGTGAVTWVANAQDSNRLVPIGAVGELLLEGPIVGQGYLHNPERTAAAFIDDPPWLTAGVGGYPGRRGRLYKTGDLVRYNQDGSLVFVGRKDNQVKIRGQRVELGEIEHVMRAHHFVDDAVVIISERQSSHGDHDHDILSFITIRGDPAPYHGRSHDTERPAEEYEQDQVNEWGNLFNSKTYTALEGVKGHQVGHDFVGWTSMYDGNDIEKEEMTEWLEDTIKSVLSRGPPGNVLEIGTGTGMLLFNLGHELQTYSGVEPSGKAIAFVDKAVRSVPTLASKVRLQQGTAADINRLDGLNSSNLVIVNSVVQYFPSLDYLSTVIKDLLRLEGTERLFLGDIRSFALSREFAVSKILHTGQTENARNELKARIAEIEEAEEELLVDPAFFSGLPIVLPDIVQHVEIVPKRMKATNELSCYRYAAIIYAKGKSKPALNIREVNSNEWVDFVAQKLDREGLIGMLRHSESPPVVAISNIPCKKTILERFIVDSLDSVGNVRADHVGWLPAARLKAHSCPSLSAVELVEIAQLTDFHVEISCARQGTQRGGMDAIFHRSKSGVSENDVIFRFPHDYRCQPSKDLASQPLRQRLSQQVEREVLERLQAKLPSYMIPRSIRTLEEIPINLSGKVDRKSLIELQPQSWLKKGSAAQPPPRSTTEWVVCDEFTRVLRIPVGINDNFFKFGGHSLNAMRAVSGINRRLAANISIGDIFEHPNAAGLAEKIDSATEKVENVAIPSSKYQGPVRQSFAQSRLWFLYQLYPRSTLYLVPLAVRARGILRLNALNTALNTLEERHESLRTVFLDQDGDGIQVVQPFQRKELTVVDLRNAEQEDSVYKRLEQDQTTAFDLRTEPGWRVKVYQIGENDYALSVLMHHIMCDGWSIDIIRKELSVLYAAALRGESASSKLTPLPIQYRDFSTWQNQPSRIMAYEDQLGYWIRQLEGNQPAELPYRKHRRDVLTGEAGRRIFEVKGTLYSQMNRFCSDHQVTPFAVLLSAFRAAHYHLTGSSDATIGTPVANRNHSELEHMIGFLVNMLCIRIQIDKLSFEGLVHRVSSTVAVALTNQDVPFEKIVSSLQMDRDLSRNPLVQITFALHSQRDLGLLTLEGMKTETIPTKAASRFDLEFHLYQEDDGLRGEITFLEELFDHGIVDSLRAAFHQALRQGLEEPGTMIESLSIRDSCVASKPLTDTGMPISDTADKLIKTKTVPSATKTAKLQRSTSMGKRAACTDMELRLQDIWARVLNMETDDIGADDSFFRLGGDSISAMKLVAHARHSGLGLSIANVFATPTLSALAETTSSNGKLLDTGLDAFALLGNPEGVPRLLSRLSSTYDLDASCIKDAYPCTSLQEGLLSLTAKSTPAYVLQSFLEIPEDVDLVGFRNAWVQVSRSLPILRTRFVQDQEFGMLQVVVDEDIQWFDGSDLVTYLSQDLSIPMELGRPLSRYAIISSPRSKRRLFVWTLHHALYDGQFLPRARELAHRIYHRKPYGEYKDFKLFIQHLAHARSFHAEDYWCAAFRGYVSQSFPPINTYPDAPSNHCVLRQRCSMPSLVNSDITVATIVRAAWSLTVATFTGTSDVVFGAIASGRTAPVMGIEDIAGPTIATVPVRIHVSPAQKISNYLRTVQDQAISMLPFEQTGLQRIKELSAEAKQACQFQTLLVIQPQEITEDLLEAQGQVWKWESAQTTAAFATYPLTLTFNLCSNGIDIEALVDQTRVSRWIITSMVEFASNLLQQLASTTEDKRIEDLVIASSLDHEKLWLWNGIVPATVDQTMNNLIKQATDSAPNASAVSAWDGELSYSELYKLANQLAGHLITLGVGSGTLVPLCFEKSKMAVVAMLAILKTGAAFVPLDPAEKGTERRELIIAQTSARIVVTSAQYASTLARPSRQVVSVNHESIISLLDDFSEDVNISPTSLAYIMFTSGSTGIPKGVIIDHRTASTSCITHGRVLGFNKSSRVLQFASYTFDASIMEIFTTLFYGGCICIPSDDDRLSVESTVNTTASNLTFLTPSVAGTLEPDHLPSLKTIILGGEQVRNDNLTRWVGSRAVFNAYGPTECTVFAAIAGTKASSLSEFRVSKAASPNIGKAVGSVCWVAAPNDHSRLMPIGAIGELLIEGPIVGRGYLNDPQKTAKAFVEDPPWLLKGGGGRDGRRGRLYKTGDLVRYDEDGTLLFIGRKDNQIKIRGQRIELGEVEHHVYSCLTEAKQVAAELITPNGSSSNPVLAVFFVSHEASKSHNVDCGSVPTVDAINIPLDVEEKIAERLPAAMIPRVYFSIGFMPVRISGKVDRERLREIGSTFELGQPHKTADKRAPSSKTELALQKIWARVLKMDADDIGVDDSFFRLGGDSVTAMQASSAAHASLGNVPTVDILRQKTISRLAMTLDSRSRGLGGDPTVSPSRNKKRPGPSSSYDQVCEVLVHRWPKLETFRPEDIENIYPCTSMQERMLKAQDIDPRNYRIRLEFEVIGGETADMDIRRISKAWRNVIQRHSLLRAVLLKDLPGRTRTLQVIFRNLPSDGIDLSPSKSSSAISSGTCCFQHHLTVVSVDPKRASLCLEINHALVDSRALAILLQDFTSALNGTLDAGRPSFGNFSTFVEVQPSEPSYSFWKKYFATLRPCILPVSGDAPSETGMASISVPGLQTSKIEAFCSYWEITAATLLRTAWAVVLHEYTGSTAPCFGVLASARHAPVKEVDDLFGPLLSLMPCGVQLHEQEPIFEILAKVHRDFISSLAHQTCTLTDEFRVLLDSAGQLFNTAISFDNTGTMSFGRHENSHAIRVQNLDDPVEWAIYVKARNDNGDLVVEMEYWEDCVAPTEANKIARLLGSTISAMVAGPHRTVLELEQQFQDVAFR